MPRSSFEGVPTLSGSYEIIRSDTPCKLVFDLDWYGYVNDLHYNEEDVCLEIIEAIRSVFKECFDIELDHKHISYLESHNLNCKSIKYSYHIIINGYRVKNNHEYTKYFAKLVLNNLKQIKDNVSQKCLNNKGQPEIPIDFSIYSRNRTFRIVGHHKQNKVNRQYTRCGG